MMDQEVDLDWIVGRSMKQLSKRVRFLCSDCKVGNFRRRSCALLIEGQSRGESLKKLSKRVRFLCSDYKLGAFREVVLLSMRDSQEVDPDWIVGRSLKQFVNKGFDFLVGIAKLARAFRGGGFVFGRA